PSLREAIGDVCDDLSGQAGLADTGGPDQRQKRRVPIEFSPYEEALFLPTDEGGPIPGERRLRILHGSPEREDASAPLRRPRPRAEAEANTDSGWPTTAHRLPIGLLLRMISLAFGNAPLWQGTPGLSLEAGR